MHRTGTHGFVGRRTTALPARAGRGAAILACAALAALAGCDSEKKITNPPSPYLPQVSATNVLLNLRQAYVDRNYDEYVRLFSDDFVFVFNPLDHMDPHNPTPETWGLEAEKDAHRNLFGAQVVEKIELTIPNPPMPVPSDNVIPDSYKVDLTAILLRVHTRLESGDILILEVPSGFATFYFKQSATEMHDGQPVWQIVRWDDQPIAGGKQAAGTCLRARGHLTETTTWGSIKAVYQ